MMLSLNPCHAAPTLPCPGLPQCDRLWSEGAQCSMLTVAASAAQHHGTHAQLDVQCLLTAGLAIHMPAAPDGCRLSCVCADIEKPEMRPRVMSCAHAAIFAAGTGGGVAGLGRAGDAKLNECLRRGQLPSRLILSSKSSAEVTGSACCCRRCSSADLGRC